jgi:predicted GTPase
LANKCDLKNENISNEDMNQFIIENGFAGWFETSAKENQGIETAAQFLVNKIMENRVEVKEENKNVITLESGKTPNQTGSEGFLCCKG